MTFIFFQRGTYTTNQYIYICVDIYIYIYIILYYIILYYIILYYIYNSSRKHPMFSRCRRSLAIVSAGGRCTRHHPGPSASSASSASSHQNMAGLTKSVGGLHLFFSIAFYGKFYGKCHLKCHHFPHWTCLKMANPGSSWAAHRRRGWEAQGWNLECEEERLEDVFLVGDEHCYPLVN